MATDTGDADGAWRVAMARFDVWLALPQAEQAAWLDALAQEDQALHRRIEGLIAADRDADAQSFLHAHAGLAGLGPAFAQPSLTGTRLGPWQVERLIGSGGMGQVWLSRRTDGRYEGLAAIKLLRLAVAEAYANARFAREGQLLGRLSHPNIARLLDAGATESGERYLVLEYVDGERIDDYCDHHRLTVGQRVALFIVVCQAVAHAHENLVVHRDLKPSNIFVTHGGQVKLLDFGVAKLLADDAAESGDRSELTRAAGAAMTPEYASPEQLSGGTVTTATDVYGLGLVLYRLLAGTRPFGDAATPTPARASRLTEEPRPLWTLPADAAAAQQLAADRATSVAALRKALHADVAVVIGKAIKADPAARYRSVPDFADDLQRVLDRRPIAARPDSLGYRTRRYVQRHAFGVGAAALIALAVGGGAVATVVQRQVAVREAQRAVAVKRFLLDLFASARTSVRGGTQQRDVTVKDVLDAGADRVGRNFAAQPALRDELFGVLIELYSETGDQARMTHLARERVASAHQAFGADDPRSVGAEVLMAGVLLNFGGDDEAKALLDHAERVLDRVGDHTSFDRALLLRWRGAYVQQQADATVPAVPWALNPMRQAAELMRARYPDEDEFLEVLTALPGMACKAGERAEALAASEELERRALARYGPDTLFSTQAVMVRARVLTLDGQPAAAIPLIGQAIDGYRRHAGPASPDVIFAQLLLAQAQAAANQPEASARSYAEAGSAIRLHHPDDARLARRLAGYGQSIQRIQHGERVGTCGKQGTAPTR